MPAARMTRSLARPTAAWLVVLTALSAGSTLAQVPTAGPEFRLGTGNDEHSPSLAVEADGGYVAVWRSGGTIAGRRLDAFGLPRGGEFLVTGAAAFDAEPAVAAHPAGGFVVGWHAADGDGNGIRARRFDAAGAPAGGEVTVTPSIAGNQTAPRVSASPHGYVFVWVTAASINRSVSARVFDPALVAQTAAIPVSGAQYAWSSPDVVARGDGVFLVAWVVSAGIVHVKIAFFDPSGAQIGSTISQFTGTYYTETPRIALAPSTSAFVTTRHDWYEFSGGGLMPTTIFDEETHVQRYDGAGAPLGPDTVANVHQPGWQENGALAITPDGRIVVAWSSVPRFEGCTGIPTCWPPPPPPPPQDGSGAGVYARIFDAAGNDVGGGEFRVNVAISGDQLRPAVAASATGFVVAFESNGVVLARRYASQLTPSGIEVDPTDEQFSDGNRVLENWEAVVVAPAWRNTTGAAQALTSTASAFTGPAGPTYAILDGAADFGVIPDGTTRSCRDIGDCFVLAVSGARPAAHWDAQITESAPPPFLFAPRTRPLHIGDSFYDVARGGPYRFVETVFHHDVMSPCAPGAFCPAHAATRETMARFVLRALNTAFVPPACVAGSERFSDVPASSPYCPWVEELARRGVVAGCGGGRYCPLGGVSRETMAVYLLLTREGSGYVPPACTTPIFNDVPASSPFCRWIEELARRGIVAGCGGGALLPGGPASPATRWRSS